MSVMINGGCASATMCYGVMRYEGYAISVSRDAFHDRE